jgi:hypothetical protein
MSLRLCRTSLPIRGWRVSGKHRPLDKSGRAHRSLPRPGSHQAGLVRRSFGRNGAPLNERFSEGGFSLVELSVALFLLTTVAVFGFQTMMSGWMLQNSSIMQSMTDAYAGIETAYAQRWTFASIPTSGRWPVYPQSSSTVVPIGKTPKRTVNATVVRTSRQFTDPLTGANSYMLESYVVYKDEQRQYCKVSKVYRTE